ncbi:RICIN domain-containing protein [Streptomyces sp. NPDC094032]|uniref:RICIN domain-containing protein n=1 Tax=Streptomyces sp. NPDC094032 TaxID=3155308 RepID=UPI00332680B5
MNARPMFRTLAGPALALAAATALLLGTGAPSSAAGSAAERQSPAPSAKPVPRPGISPLGTTAYGWIRNYNSNKCLAVPGATQQPAARLIQWTCGANTDHYWEIRYEGEGDGESWYSIRNKNSGMCLSIDAAQTGDYAPATQYFCGNATEHLFVDQYWALRYDSARQANQFVNWNSRKCLAVLGAATNDGASVIQWTCGSNPDHYWR